MASRLPSSSPPTVAGAPAASSRPPPGQRARPGRVPRPQEARIEAVVYWPVGAIVPTSLIANATFSNGQMAQTQEVMTHQQAVAATDTSTGRRGVWPRGIIEVPPAMVPLAGAGAASAGHPPAGADYPAQAPTSQDNPARRPDYED